MYLEKQGLAHTFIQEENLQNQWGKGAHVLIDFPVFFIYSLPYCHTSILGQDSYLLVLRQYRVFQEIFLVDLQT